MPRVYRKKKVKVKAKKKKRVKVKRKRKRKAKKKGGAILGAAIWPGWGWLLPF